MYETSILSGNIPLTEMECVESKQRTVLGKKSQRSFLK